MVKNYIPERGDLVFLDFFPQMGREESGRRPALVLSPLAYNAKTGLALFCPITSKSRGYPFEVSLTENTRIHGVVLADAVKNLDWRARKASLAGHISETGLQEVSQKLALLLQLN